MSLFLGVHVCERQKRHPGRERRILTLDFPKSFTSEWCMTSPGIFSGFQFSLYLQLKFQQHM